MPELKDFIRSAPADLNSDFLLVRPSSPFFAASSNLLFSWLSLVPIALLRFAIRAFTAVAAAVLELENELKNSSTLVDPIFSIDCTKSVSADVSIVEKLDAISTILWSAILRDSNCPAFKPSHSAMKFLICVANPTRPSPIFLRSFALATPLASAARLTISFAAVTDAEMSELFSLIPWTAVP